MAFMPDKRMGPPLPSLAFPAVSGPTELKDVGVWVRMGPWAEATPSQGARI